MLPEVWCLIHLATESAHFRQPNLQTQTNLIATNTKISDLWIANENLALCGTKTKKIIEFGLIDAKLYNILYLYKN